METELEKLDNEAERVKNELIAGVDKLIKKLDERDRFVRLYAQEACDKNEKIKVWIDNRLYIGKWRK